MATPQQSLFGMFQSPAQIEQAQQQRLFEQARQSAMMTPEQQGAFIAARSGQMTGRLLSDIAGYEDPALKKARDLQGIANEVKSSMSAEDQKDPAKVYAAMAKRASEMGYTQEAMLLADEANRRSIEERKLSLTERGVKVQEEQVQVSKDKLKAELEDTARKNKFTDAQIREIEARIGNLNADKYSFQTVKDALGNITEIIAINKTNPSDVKNIKVAGGTTPSSLDPAAAARAELEKRNKGKKAAPSMTSAPEPEVGVSP